MPGHNFTFDVSDDTKASYESVKVPKGNWIFEVRDKNNQPLKNRTIQLWPPAGKAKEEDKAHDSSYIMRVEGKNFHENKKLKRYKKPFNKVFYFHYGDVKSECLTMPLLNRQQEKEGNNCWKDIGKIAEIVGVEITLPQDTSLVLVKEKKNKSGDEDILWKNTWKDGVAAEARILNVRSDVKGDHKGEHNAGRYRGLWLQLPERF